ncbi:cobalamin-binding protein [Oceanobacillus picturae]|uniref:Cobalamin-binding protein n=1 Tax=Oceanobacillus picturae TaxID=171693 RepID=A0A0U9H426_9BACI|nr:cobalamin-binding protein [Oceanobacillus picturae]
MVPIIKRKKEALYTISPIITSVLDNIKMLKSHIVNKSLFFPLFIKKVVMIQSIHPTQ